MAWKAFGSLLLASLGLCACSESSSTGFSGIGDEPGSVSRQSPGEVATRFNDDFFEPGRVPVSQIQASSPDRATWAAQAMEYGAHPQAPTVEVPLGGQQLPFSIVEVSGTPFAVVAPAPDDKDTEISAAALNAFEQNAAAYSGCVRTGAAQMKQTRRKGIAAAAIPLSCR